MNQGLTRKAIVAGAFALTLSGAFGIQPAHADQTKMNQLQEQTEAMVQKVEEAAQAYTNATADVEELAQQMATNRERSADIQNQLPDQRKRTAASIKEYYLFEQSTSSMLQLIFQSESFDDFISTMHTIDKIHERNTKEIQALVDMEEELNQAQAELEVELDQALQRQNDALHALDDVRTSRNELQEHLDQLTAEAAASKNKEGSDATTAIVKEATKAADQAVEALPVTAQKATEPTATTTSTAPAPAATQDKPAESSNSSAQTPATPAPAAEQKEQAAPAAEQPKEQATPAPAADPAPAASTPATQTSTSSDGEDWAARIDAYLAGSAMEGHGADFAAAAAEYGVDPRLSPAIATIESGKGAVCFQPYNAWGWGSSSWSDWTDAIYGHVSGFSSGYGSDITLEEARMYAGDDSIYETWYNLVQSEMSSI